MAVERRVLWLGAALVVVVATLVVRSSGDDAAPAPAATPQPRARGAAPKVPGAVDSPPQLALNLESLRRERVEPAEGGRNPFRFRPPPAPPPAPPVVVSRPGNETPAPVLPPVPAGPPPPPPIPLKFIGIVQKVDGTKIAVLSDGKRPPIHGIEGQEIEGRYKILKIGLESIELSYLDGRGRQTIRLTGQ